jgi:outer membrane receptor for ferrienterochelin and colicin
MNATRTCITIILFLFLSTALHAQQGEVLTRIYKPAFAEATIQAYIEDIEKQTGIPVSYSNTSVNLSKRVTLVGNEQTVKDVLTTILSGEQIEIIGRRNKILLVPYDSKKARKARFVTINGYIKEEGSMEALPGAVVFIPALKAGTTTNSYGYFSLTIPEGEHTVFCTYIGYKTDTSVLSLKENTRKDILLPAQNVLTEVKVVSTKEAAKEHHHLTYADLTERPSLLGENDIMRALQNYAGVTTTTEGSNKVLVRGGDPGQNLHLVDGVPLYYTDHFFGLTSVFNSEAIKSADFYKGAFPAKYGGRLSSVIDINTKDGDMEQWGGQFTLGLIKGSLNVEGPIVKDKASIMISLRRTWIDAFWRFSKQESVRQTKFDFYDLNIKTNYILDKNNRIYLSVYNGRDQIKINPGSGELFTRWGNALGSVRWNRIINAKTFLNTTLTYSNFKFSLQQKQDFFTGQAIVEGNEYKGTSNIKDLALTSQLTWYANTSNKVDIGIHYSYAHFIPVKLETFLTQQNISIGIRPLTDQFNCNEVTLYAEDEIKLNNKWTLRPGFHFANWIGKKFNYSSLQPRLYGAYKMAPSHTLHASFTQMAQFLHFINNNTYGLPVDFWIPSTSNLQPEESYMATFGYCGNPGKNFSYDIEFYYKDINNVTTYSMGKNIFDNSKSWEDNLTQGRGWSYGTEISLNEKIGSFRFRLAYTLSWSWRQFADFNNGKAFPYRFDRRHNIRAAAIYRPSKKFEASANWTYMSGEAITLPDQVYPDLDQNLLINPSPQYYSSSFTYNYVEWNNYRLPPLHRLDLAMRFTKTKGKRMERTWSFGVYNAYMRQNVMLVTLETDGGTNGGFKLSAMSFLQFIPYVSYQLIF